MTIRQIHNPWRDNMLPAKFRDAPFFVEANSTEGGRRIVQHQYPKKDTPYAEDMGRLAKTITVRAYCISYPYDAGTDQWPLFMRDYRLARDILQARLDEGQYGGLQLPYSDSPYAKGQNSQITVACERYRMTEDERFGGYCTFDITFVEAGAIPNTPAISTGQAVLNGITAMRNQVMAQLAKGTWTNVTQPPPPLPAPGSIRLLEAPRAQARRAGSN